MGIGAAILGGGVLSAVGADRAADAGAAAADASTALQRDIYNQNQERLQPFTNAGSNALNALMYELGLGDRPTFGNDLAIQEIPGQPTGGPFQRAFGTNLSPSTYQVGDRTFDSRDAAQAYVDANPAFEYQGMGLSPAAQFALEQGRDTIEAGAAGAGGLFSGRTAAGLERTRFGLAAQDRENQLNRLMGLVSTGQSAAAGQGAAGIDYANNTSNALFQGANARASGAVGVGNAFNDAVGNYIGYQNYQNLLTKFPGQA